MYIMNVFGIDLLLKDGVMRIAIIPHNSKANEKSI